MKNDFIQKLLSNILFNQEEYGQENYDENRFGVLNEKKMESWKKCIVRFLAPEYIENKVEIGLSPSEIDFWGLQEVYDLLEDDASKNLLIKLIEYRVLGYKKVKLPVSVDKKFVLRLLPLQTGDEEIEVSYLGMKKNLQCFKLDNIGKKLSVYGLPAGLSCCLQGHYEYKTETCVIAPQKDDIVIDGGACWGEVALFFADAVGENGKIFSFEFVPENLKIFRRNLELNPRLKGRIHIVEHAMLDSSGIALDYGNNGPATRVRIEGDSFLSSNGQCKEDNGVTTLSIDDLVEKKELSKVDFIKMDIEGCELAGLKGAEKTLKKYKPKLAISLYHKVSDFTDIPLYLKELNLGYKFYLGHHTIHAEETVLYATAR